MKSHFKWLCANEADAETVVLMVVGPGVTVTADDSKTDLAYGVGGGYWFAKASLELDTPC